MAAGPPAVAVMGADGATVAGTEPAARRPTLQDLMRHTAGLSSTDPVTGAAQSLPDLTRPLAMECGGGCGVSTAIDYLRFAQMLLNRGSLGDRRVLGRKSVEFMTADQLGPDVNVDRLWQFPNLNGYGFGLGVAMRRRPGVAGVMGSPGDFSWSGSDGTYFWVGPTEDLAVVFMSAAPGAVRQRHRQLLTAVVLQAIVD